MRVSILAATLLLLLPAASSTAQEGDAAPAEQIRYAVVDGGRTTIWVAYANGRTMYAQYDRRDALTVRIDLRTPPEAFQRLQTSLAPFEAARGLTCSGQARQTPQDELSWLRGVQTVSLGLRPACGGREIGAAFGELIAASRVTGRSDGNDQWVVGPEAASVQTPVPIAPASDRMAVRPASETIDVIAYREIGPRGVGGLEWRVDREGRGSLMSYGDPEDPVVNRTFSVGVGGFERIRETLKSMEDLQTACPDRGEFHEPIGFWSWVRGDQTTSVRLEQSCMTPARDAANGIVLGWADPD
jgi:hypothetical protein